MNLDENGQRPLFYWNNNQERTSLSLLWFMFASLLMLCISDLSRFLCVWARSPLSICVSLCSTDDVQLMRNCWVKYELVARVVIEDLRQYQFSTSANTSTQSYTDTTQAYTHTHTYMDTATARRSRYAYAKSWEHRIRMPCGGNCCMVCMAMANNCSASDCPNKETKRKNHAPKQCALSSVLSCSLL